MVAAPAGAGSGEWPGRVRYRTAMASRAAASPGATDVITWHVTAGREAEFEAWAHEMTGLASRQEGHLGAAWLRPNDPGGDYQVVVRFTTDTLLDRWMSSDLRRRQVAKLDGIATAEEVRQTGLETWFSLPGLSVPPPPRWKMALVTFSAVYPIVIVFNWLVAGPIHGWPLLARSLVLPAFLVPMLTFVIMPRLSRLLRRWLYQRP